MRARFIDALDLKGEPATAQRLIDLATAASQKAPIPRAPATPERRTNLPAQLTRFIGREREMAEVTRLLGATRLLTLTGSGGAGKTRLALEVGVAGGPRVAPPLQTAYGWWTWRRSPNRDSCPTPPPLRWVFAR